MRSEFVAEIVANASATHPDNIARARSVAAKGGIDTIDTIKGEILG
jgi:hypothetical protein